MKLTIGILAIILQIASVHSVAVASADATEECGSLGVLDVDLSNLPEGMTPSDVRKCADHPFGGKSRKNAQWESLAPMEDSESDLTNRSNIIESRAAQICDLDAPYGCTDGYCWKACGASGSGIVIATPMPLAGKAMIASLVGAVATRSSRRGRVQA
ncbi:hypothetical protein PQX77_002206 [Marasmius sp. AFHP31]|nr:hypothetical protein PQX77_002206 [Marasmius sp. AFHP31]